MQRHFYVTNNNEISIYINKSYQTFSINTESINCEPEIYYQFAFCSNATVKSIAFLLLCVSNQSTFILCRHIKVKRL